MHEDVLLELEMRGELIPSSVSIELGGNTFRMKKEGGKRFTYLIKNLEEDLPFSFEASGFKITGI